MDLFENPFYLLEVSTRDQAQTIVLASEEKSLIIDHDICTKARTTLINPKQRLSAEVSWLPGMAPGKAFELIQKINTLPKEVTNIMSMLPPLVQCNLSTSMIKRWTFKDNMANLENWILYITNSYENIDAGELLVLLNEDRTVARFPSIPQKEDIEQELNIHRTYLVEILKNALNGIPDPDVFLAGVLEQTIKNGAQVPLLLDDLTELYRIEVQKYLDQLSDEIDQMISSLKNDLTENDGVLSNLYKRISRLEETLKAWAQIAKPLNLVMHNRGLQDDHSIHLATKIRNMAIFLANEHGLHAEARLITCLMGEVFENLPQVFERINEDIRALDDILIEKRNEKEQPEIVRLIGEMLRKLSQGEKIQFGDIVVNNNGIILNKTAHSKKGRVEVFESKPYCAKWEELTISNKPGVFIIESTKEKQARVEFSYRDMDDVHILEAVMRFLYKDENYIKLQQGLFS